MRKISEAKMNPDIQESMNSKKYAKEKEEREEGGVRERGKGLFIL